MTNNKIRLLRTFIFLITLLLICNEALAEDVPYTSKEMPLGESTLSISLDSHSFTHDDVSYYDLDSGVGITVEAYLAVAPKLYVGGAIGYAMSEGSFIWMDSSLDNHKVDTKLMYVPIEVNVKYIFEISQDLMFSLGAGLSKNYIKEKRSMFQSGYYGEIFRTTDTLSGTQFFGELIFRPKYDDFYAGVKFLNKKMGSLYTFKRDYSHNSLSLFVGYYY